MSTKRLPRPRRPRKLKARLEPWPPLWARLPDSVKHVEQGQRLAAISDATPSPLQAAVPRPSARRTARLAPTCESWRSSTRIVDYTSISRYTASMKVTERLRQALETSPKSRYQLSKETGIDPAVLHRFLYGQSGLSSGSIDALAAALGLELKAKRRPPRSKPGE